MRKKFYMQNMTNAATETMHVVPEDLAQLLSKNADVARIWDALTPLSRNEWICYVTIVKKQETRDSHLRRLQEDLLKGKKRPCCWPGCPHHRPNAAKWFPKNI